MDLKPIIEADGFQRIAYLDDAAGNLVDLSEIDVEARFAKLLAFAKDLYQEDRRGISEQLTEDELAVLDLLMKPQLELTAEQVKEVKLIARRLLQTLKQAKLVLDWRKKLRTRADVYVTVSRPTSGYQFHRKPGGKDPVHESFRVRSEPREA